VLEFGRSVAKSSMCTDLRDAAARHLVTARRGVAYHVAGKTHAHWASNGQARAARIAVPNENRALPADGIGGGELPGFHLVARMLPPCAAATLRHTCTHLLTE
jgi:hypothetical protein